MSDSDGGPGRREVAHRLFAAEYDDADLSYSESDEERAPNYVVTPSGSRVNRLFVVGVLTEVESVSDDYLRARVVDPTGPFVIYAGQYQPEAMRFLESADPPTFVAVTGKARTFQPDDSDRVYTSIRPESINEVDADTRDRWVIQAAENTLDRVARAAEAKASGLSGDDLEASLRAADVDDSLASGIPIAFDHYETTGDYLADLREISIDALRVVAGERDEVASTLAAPDQGGDGPLGDLAERTLEAVETEPSEEPAVGEAAEASEPQAEATATEPSSAETTETANETSAAETDQPDTAEATDAQTEPQVATAGDASAAAEEETEATEEPDETDLEEPEDDTEDSDDLGDFEGDFDLDEDEREEIESEYGTEFKSGTEVEEPGEADIDTPDPEEVEPVDTEPEEADVESTMVESDEAVAETEPVEPGEESDVVEADESETETVDVDLDDAVMDAMTDLDDGDGADHDAVVAAVVDRTGADPADVEDAIEDALMDGRCYEPNDGTLKPI